MAPVDQSVFCEMHSGKACDALKHFVFMKVEFKCNIIIGIDF